MNLKCPHCLEPVPYDPRLAGSSIVCSYCKRPLLVPQLQALPPEIQDEYRREVAKAFEKQEAAKRAEAARIREQAEKEDWAKLCAQQQAKEAQRRQEEAQRQQEEARKREIAMEHSRAAKQEWDAKVTAVTNGVPEEAAMTNRYPALQTIATIIKVIAIAIIVLNSLGWLVETGIVLASGREDTTIGVLTIFGTLIAVAVINVLVWAFGFAYAELIRLQPPLRATSHCAVYP